MDALKNIAGGSSSHGNANAGNAGRAPGEKKDLGDRIAGFANKKEGNKFSDQQLESGTDKIRGMYEKATGNKVNPKISQ
ncbi:hypothetical protein GGR52DRAFT_206690 [Hypoxylon sp. FL1284]|nr:hypothetical protein GGR52DRAFT_206690 [Hypoxylon sp. FL1284]